MDFQVKPRKVITGFSTRSSTQCARLCAVGENIFVSKLEQEPLLNTEDLFSSCERTVPKCQSSIAVLAQLVHRTLELKLSEVARRRGDCPINVNNDITERCGTAW